MKEGGGGAPFSFFLSWGETATKRRITKKKKKEGRERRPEKRSISIVFDGKAKELTVYQDGSAQALNNVTATVTSINGYNDQISLGINSADWDIVFQTYEPDSTRAEFGVCSPNTQPLP